MSHTAGTRGDAGREGLRSNGAGRTRDGDTGEECGATETPGAGRRDRGRPGQPGCAAPSRAMGSLTGVTGVCAAVSRCPSRSTRGRYGEGAKQEKFKYALTLVFIQCVINAAFAKLRKCGSPGAPGRLWRGRGCS